jgi:hypothetical protein
MIFFNLWVGRAMKTILSRNFACPAQRWGRVGLGGGGAVKFPVPSPPSKALASGAGEPRGEPTWQPSSGGPRGAGRAYTPAPATGDRLCVLPVARHYGAAMWAPPSPACPTCPQVGGAWGGLGGLGGAWGGLGGLGGGLGGSIRGLGGSWGGPGWVQHHPLLWLPLPPNFLGNFIILTYLLEILVFFCEIFLYLKLKWSSLVSPLGFSFYENLTTI